MLLLAVPPHAVVSVIVAEAPPPNCERLAVTDETSPAVELLSHVTVTVSLILNAPPVPVAPAIEMSALIAAGATASVNAGVEDDVSVKLLAVLVPSVSDEPAVYANDKSPTLVLTVVVVKL